MKGLLALLASVALVSAGGIPQYSIEEIQPDRIVRVDRGIGSLGGIGLGSRLLTKSIGQPLLLAEPSIGLDSRSLGLSSLSLSEPRLIRIDSRDKGLNLGLGLAEPELSLSRSSLRLEPQLVSLSEPQLLGKGLGLARTTIIRQSQPVITKTLISQPQLIRTVSVAEPTILRSEPLLLNKGLGLSGLGGLGGLSLSEPILLGGLGKGLLRK
jgi:hypothetical protein